MHRITDSWGYHLLMDCSNGDIDSISDKENIENFVNDLVDEIDMKAYGPPLIVHFAEHDEDKAGYSLCQMIETSNITGHFVDANGNFYIDIFSCKPFSMHKAVAVVQSYFSPTNIKTHFISRDA